MKTYHNCNEQGWFAATHTANGRTYKFPDALAATRISSQTDDETLFQQR